MAMKKLILNITTFSSFDGGIFELFILII